MQLEIAHMCIVVSDLNRAMESCRSLWSIGPFRVFDFNPIAGTVRGKKKHYNGKIAFAQAGPIEIELIEPEEGESIWWECLHTRGESVHHLGVFVTDLDQEITKYKKNGIGILQTGENERVKLAYMDTEKILGIIVELIEKK